MIGLWWQLAGVFIWVANIVYGLLRAFDDIRARRWGWVAAGAFCVIGVNIIVGAIIHISLAHSTDL